VKRWICAAALAIPLAVLGGPQGGLPDGKWWKHPRIARELGLSDAQVSEIEKIFLRTRPQLIDLRADLEKKQVAKNALLDQENVDSQEASRRIDDVEQARGRLEKTRAMMWLEIRKQLNPEQRKKALELTDRFRENRQQRMQRRRIGPPPGER
jgi:Spy/CpxP family protein refolding chaperone